MNDRVFRDPVHGLIEFKGDCRPLQRLLDTRAVQRLRRIKQVGFAWLVYPGAEHSRFGHALGAYHVASRMGRALGLEPDVLRHVLVAALLHDVGHGPFSHAWEQAFAGDDHERWGARIVTEDPELAAVLEDIEPALPATLVKFWSKDYRPRYARKLVSSQLDADRLDYLLRDGHYSGAGYATYDLDWLLYALRIAEIDGDGDDPADLVVDYARGRYAVEQYLFARAYMYAQVYHHKTVRAAEWMFLKLLERYATLVRAGRAAPGLVAAERLARGERIATHEYLLLDDVAVLGAIQRWAGRSPGGEPAADDAVLVDLARRLVDRRLFKTFDLTGSADATARVEAVARELAEARFGEAADCYWQIDRAQRVAYSPQRKAELRVVDHPLYGTVDLGELLSGQAASHPVATVRLVCAPELVAELTPHVAAAMAGGSRPR